MADGEVPPQPPEDAEDCPGSTRGNQGGMSPKTGDIAADPRKDVKCGELQVTEESLDERPRGEQAKHIHENVKEADVEEHRREEPPGLAVENDGRTGGRPPRVQLVDRRVEHRHAGGDHDGEDHDAGQREQRGHDRAESDASAAVVADSSGYP